MSFHWNTSLFSPEEPRRNHTFVLPEVKRWIDSIISLNLTVVDIGNPFLAHVIMFGDASHPTSLPGLRPVMASAWGPTRTWLERMECVHDASRWGSVFRATSLLTAISERCRGRPSFSQGVITTLLCGPFSLQGYQLGQSRDERCLKQAISKTTQRIRKGKKYPSSHLIRSPAPILMRFQLKTFKFCQKYMLNRLNSSGRTPDSAILEAYFDYFLGKIQVISLSPSITYGMHTTKKLPGHSGTGVPIEVT